MESLIKSNANRAQPVHLVLPGSRSQAPVYTAGWLRTMGKGNLFEAKDLDSGSQKIFLVAIHLQEHGGHLLAVWSATPC